MEVQSLPVFGMDFPGICSPEPAWGGSGVGQRGPPAPSLAAVALLGCEDIS